MNPFMLAWRRVRAEPLRLALAVAGVAIVGALLLTMLLLARGLEVSFAHLLESTGYDVRITATAALPSLGAPIPDASPVAAVVRTLPEVSEATPVAFGVARVRHGKGRRSVGLIGGERVARGEWEVARGRPARAPDEVLVNEALAKLLRLEAGSSLALEPGSDGAAASALPAVMLRVTGIAAFPFDATNDLTARVAYETLCEKLTTSRRDDADMILVASRAGVSSERTVEAIRARFPALRPISNQEMMRELRLRDFSYFRQVASALAMISTFFAFLLVATLLSASVGRRLGEVAALRAIGLSRARVAVDLFVEALLLVGAGGVLAIPLGLLLARVLDDILRSMPTIPARVHFFVLEPLPMLLHVMLLLAAGLLAAAWPVMLAVRAPIAATLRSEVVS